MTDPSDISDICKSFESATELELDSKLPIVIRLDGCAFHTLTRGLRRPCEARLTKCMVATAKDLVEKFSARLGFTQSDEITLILCPAIPYLMDVPDAVVTPETMLQLSVPSDPRKYTHIYSGRVQKLASLTASYASARFNYHLSQQDWSDYTEKIQSRLKSHTSTFDSRVFSVPSAREAMLCVWWRHALDCRRNAVSAVAQSVFSHRELQGVSVRDMLDMLKDKKGIDIYNNLCDLDTLNFPTDAIAAVENGIILPREFVFGCFIKKEIYTIEVIDRLTGIKQMCSRSRICARSFQWKGSEEERTLLTMQKRWDQ